MFWELTPRELDAVALIHTRRDETDVERFATIAAALYNQVYQKPDKSTWKREEFGAKPPVIVQGDWRKRYPKSEADLKMALGQALVGNKPNGS